MRIGLLSDTHGHLDKLTINALNGCDEIWHAGDIGSLNVADTLAEMAPLRAVYGNIDDSNIRITYPEFQSFETAGLRVLMTHIGGRPGNYRSEISARMTNHKPDVFICGHSHILLVQRAGKSGVLHMNPGAAGTHGFHHVRTILRFNIIAGKPAELEVVELGPRVRRSTEE